jgi:hypothetical protein
MPVLYEKTQRLKTRRSPSSRLRRSRRLHTGDHRVAQQVGHSTAICAHWVQRHQTSAVNSIPRKWRRAQISIPFGPSQQGLLNFWIKVEG